MIELDLKPLMARLNPYCTRALEGAAGMCVSRGNYEVTLEHLMLAFIEDPSRDFQTILRHFEIDSAQVCKNIQLSVEEHRVGNAGKPVFSPLLMECMEDAWLIASVELGMGDIRSGVLIAAMLSNPNRYGYQGCDDLLASVSVEELRRRLPDIVEGSSEESTQLGL